MGRGTWPAARLVREALAPLWRQREEAAATRLEELLSLSARATGRLAPVEGEGRARWRRTGEEGEDRGEGIGHWVARCDGCGSERIGRCGGVRRTGRDRQEGVGLGLEGGAAGPGRPAQWREKKWQRPGGLTKGLAGLQEADWACSSLPLILIFFSRKQIREKKKRKRGLTKEFAHGGNFPGLAKICSFQEK